MISCRSTEPRSVTTRLCTTILCAIFFGLLLFFYTNKISAKESFPSCATLPSGAKQIFGVNCLLPICPGSNANSNLGLTCTLNPCDIPPSGSQSVGSNCLLNCSTVSYPSSANFQITCNVPSCSQPLKDTDRPRINCLLQKCGQPLEEGDLPETNCSLLPCPSLLTSDDIPGKTCSFPHCSRPKLAIDDQPGLNCALPLCSQPTDEPRINCLLPTCSKPAENGTRPEGEVVNKTCMLPFCPNIRSPDDRPEINCLLPFCKKPLDKNDQPGVNCTLRPCPNPALPKDNPGIECTLPNCIDLGPLTVANPGINCLYVVSSALPNCVDFKPLKDAKPGINCLNGLNDRIVPLCTNSFGRNIHLFNCKDPSDLPNCSTLPEDQRFANKNCIKNCSTPPQPLEKPGINCMLRDCGDLPDAELAQPGNNCLFSINGKLLPTCKANPNLKHRVECADIIDLTLCDHTQPCPKGKEKECNMQRFPTFARPGRNCVNTCKSTPNPNPERKPPYKYGIDYAVHNTDCVEFCTDEKVTPFKDHNCVNPMCHQITSSKIGNDPKPTGESANCRAMGCNFLTVDELIEMSKSTYSDESKQYCDATNTKCYDFSKEQLRYIPYRKQNKFCNIHKCKPTTDHCGIDETDNVKRRDSTGLHAGKYLDLYQRRFTLGIDINLDQLMCEQVTCPAIITKQYRCLKPNEPNPENPNLACNKSGPGSECFNGYCYKTIDCGDSNNNKIPECVMNSDKKENEEDAISLNDDLTDAWFYRPMPRKTSYRDEHSDDKGYRDMYSMNESDNEYYKTKAVDRLCYTPSNMQYGQPENQKALILNPFSKDMWEGIGTGLTEDTWGREIKTPEINFGFGSIPELSLGYFHSALPPNSARSPGMCDATRNGFRGPTVLFLCGNEGLSTKPIADYAGYYRGYASTKFSDRNATHDVTICLRFKNFFASLPPADACGRRECAVTCAFGLCASQMCGEDVCTTLTIDDNNPKACEAKEEIMKDTGGVISTMIAVASPIGAPAIMIGAAADGDTVDDDTFNPASKDFKLECMRTIDEYLRVRAVKYGRQIVAFIDVKGTTAYSPIYLNSAERLGDKTCVSGKNNNEGVCDGFDSNAKKGSLSRWRTALKIPFILDAMEHYPPSARVVHLEGKPDTENRGYLSKDGEFFAAQEASLVKLRIAPPRFYVLANKDNSYGLFIPPVTILNSRVKKGGATSPFNQDGDFGATDFHYPEIEIGFVKNTYKLSLIYDQTGYETPSPEGSYATATSGDGTNAHSVEVFVRKEFDDSAKIPTFCLYRRVKDYGGAYIDPIRIECVNRKLPELHNFLPTNLRPEEPRRVVVSEPTTPINTFNNSKIAIRFLVTPGANNIDENCEDKGDDLCTSAIELDNKNPDKITTSLNLERYKIGVQRDECSQLNIECIQNEINLNNARFEQKPVTSFEHLKLKCEQTLLPVCNAKKGIITMKGANVINPNPNNLEGNKYLYGWFNELCIVSGFERKTRQVVAHGMANNLLGRCELDPNSPYEKDDGNPNTNCNDGGKAPNCICLEYNPDIRYKEGRIRREETPHEAGLCIEMPTLKTCNPVNYNPNKNQHDPYDLEYVKKSLNLYWSSDPYYPEYVKKSLNLKRLPDPSAKYCSNPSSYNTSWCVHPTHQFRTENKDPDSPIGALFQILGHAEFGYALPGMNNVVGECKGFWREQSDDTGKPISPKANCVVQNGNPTWIGAKPICERYTCPAVIAGAFEPITLGGGEGQYHIEKYSRNEMGDDMGRGEGFAEWRAFTKTSDFLEVAFERTNSTSKNTFEKCLPGYKVAGSWIDPKTLDDVGTEWASIKNTHISEFMRINNNSYVGGTAPTRSCNQLGEYLEVFDPCVRITCPPVNPPIPTSESDSDAWKLWELSGGASFSKETKASRSETSASRSDTSTNGEKSAFDPKESTAEGVCNESLGFFQKLNSPPPTRVCDHRGNWQEVKDKCVSSCDAISLADSSTGYSTWAKAEDVPFAGELLVNHAGCVDNEDLKIKYLVPGYPPYKNKYGIIPEEDIEEMDKKILFYQNLISQLDEESQKYNIAQQVTSYKGEITKAEVRKDYNQKFISDNKVMLQNLTSSNYPAKDWRPQRTCQSVIIQNKSVFIWTEFSSSCITKCPGSLDDPRINAGITEHPTKKQGKKQGKIQIKWDPTDFGKWTYSYSPNSASYHNASQYSPNRDNGYYILGRYCNPDTRRWDYPVPMCATNEGEVPGSNAIYNKPEVITDLSLLPLGFGATFAVNSTANRMRKADGQVYDYFSEKLVLIGGTCKPGFAQNDKGIAPIKTFYCEEKDFGQNIDEFYFKESPSRAYDPVKKSYVDGPGKECKKYCKSLRPGDGVRSDEDNTLYPKIPESGLKEIDETIDNLSCAEGSGNAFTHEQQDLVSVSHNCGRDKINPNAKTDRSTLNPKATCKDNGDLGANYEVYNGCKPCRDCTASSGIYGSFEASYRTYCEAYIKYSCKCFIGMCGTCYHDYWTWSYNFQNDFHPNQNMSHGSKEDRHNNGTHEHCTLGSYCMGAEGNASMFCNDGLKIIIASGSDKAAFIQPDLSCGFTKP